MNTTIEAPILKNTAPSSIDVEQYLRHHDNEYALRILPAIIVLVILMVVGFVGNIVVCYVYLFKFRNSTTRCFIVALAMFDLISCTFSIPIEVVDMRFNYTFGRIQGVCKLGRMFVSFSSIASGSVLLAVAVDRYRKICNAFGVQTTPKMAVAAIIICSASALIVALPSAIIYGSRTISTYMIYVNGSDCSTADEYTGTLYPLVYNGVQFVIFIAATLSMTVLYIMIWRQVCNQQTFRKGIKRAQGNEIPKRHVFASFRDKSSYSADTSDDLFDTESAAVVLSQGIELSRLETGLLKTSNDSISGILYPNSPQGRTHNAVTSKQVSRTKVENRRSERGVRRTTFMLFLITVVFVLSYLPHLGLMTARAINSQMFSDIGASAETAYNLFLRSYFINSASNPIIYSLYNAQFRREVLKLVRKLTCRS